MRNHAAVRASPLAAMRGVCRGAKLEAGEGWWWLGRRGQRASSKDCPDSGSVPKSAPVGLMNCILDVLERESQRRPPRCHLREAGGMELLVSDLESAVRKEDGVGETESSLSGVETVRCLSAVPVSREVGTWSSENLEFERGSELLGVPRRSLSWRQRFGGWQRTDGVSTDAGGPDWQTWFTALFSVLTEGICMPLDGA